MTAVVGTKTYTAEEYLALEVESDTRSEFRDGEIIATTGGTPTHNQLSSALNALLWLGLRKKPYTVFVTDQRLWIPTVNLYTYPDIMVVADPVELKPGRKDTVVNPILIAEVLSSSTEAYDHNKKFAHYRTIETFQEYVLIDQYRPHVEHYEKQTANQWLFTEYNALDERFIVSSIGIEIAIADLYEAVEFA
ncbi:MAG: Uma2 family endonuclease [Phormidesmis sp.]